MIGKVPRPKPAPFRHKKNGWKIHFCFNGKQYKTYVGKDERIACVLQSRVNNLVTEIKYGLITVPHNTYIRDFVFSQVIKEPDIEEISNYTTVTYLSELIIEYLENIPSKAPGTIKTEKTHLAHLTRFLKHKKRDPFLRDISVSFFEDYKRHRKEHVSNNTINKEIVTFQRIFAYGIEKEYLEINVARNVKKEQKQLRERSRTTAQVKDILERGDYSEERIKAIKRYRYLNSEEITALVDLAKEKLGEKHWLVPIIITLSYTGIRRGELIALEWGDIDFEKEIIFIKSRKQSKTVEYQVREVDISPQLLTILLEQKEKVKESWVFPGPNGGKLSPHSLRSAFLRVIKNTDFEGIGFHCVRYSFASILASKGVDARVIGDIMGHTTQEMMEHYRHLFPKNRKEALDKLSYE